MGALALGIAPEMRCDGDWASRASCPSGSVSNVAKTTFLLILLVALGALVSNVAAESNFTTKLDAYAKSIVDSAKHGTCSYIKSR